MFSVVVDQLGAKAVEITPVQESLKYTTAAVGGFGSCSFNLLGDRRRDVPKLAMVRIYVGTSLAWEGRVEDHAIQPADDPVTTSVTCFGLQRRLSDVSVRRIWSKRDFVLNQASPALIIQGGALLFDPSLVVTVGAFLATDPTQFGVEIRGSGGPVIAQFHANGAAILAPVGMTLARLAFDVVVGGANVGPGNLNGLLSSFSATGTSRTDVLNITATGVGTSTGNVLPAGAAQLLLAMYNANAVGIAPTVNDFVQFSNIRALGTSLIEDLTGSQAGFYGGSILADLIALVPGLVAGMIEAGSDYAIPTIDRAVRDTCMAVVNEVASYYTREWAVWEDGRFDWKAVNLDEPQWIIPFEQLLPGTRIETSIDTLASQVYVLFSEALDGNTSEQTAAAADARNPLVKAGVTKDELLQGPAVMTDNSALLLAQAEAPNQAYPPVNGTVVLNARSLIRNAVGSAQPAALIRAGTNVYLPGMPKTDSILAALRRDGETLFHVVTSEVDMENGTVTLELEGQARQIDVITARLAASTRVVTG